MQRLAILTLFLLSIASAYGGDAAVDSFKSVVAKFPKTATSASSKATYPLSDVRFDVKKTDSLVSPVLGIIDFTVSFPGYAATDPPVPVKFRMEFTWSENHWSFARLLNSKGVDVTAAPGGADLIGAGPLSTFLQPLKASP